MIGQRFTDDLIRGDFVRTERDDAIERLAKSYEDQTESYDQRVCSFRNSRGVAMPANGHEQGMISRNAKTVRDRIMCEAQELDITWREIRDCMNSRP